mmetsp:Transcript_16100/g.31511  ORF Transcript_16100/g.31511 Transcript_16100/m.31511 type:complete len:210 (-) Transcript_16100:175-804(-)
MLGARSDAVNSAKLALQSVMQEQTSVSQGSTSKSNESDPRHGGAAVSQKMLKPYQKASTPESNRISRPAWLWSSDIIVWSTRCSFRSNDFTSSLQRRSIPNSTGNRTIVTEIGKSVNSINSNTSTLAGSQTEPGKVKSRTSCSSISSNATIASHKCRRYSRRILLGLPRRHLVRRPQRSKRSQRQQGASNAAAGATLVGGIAATSSEHG